MLNSVTADNLSQELKSAGSSGGYTEYTPHLSLPKGEYTFTCSGGGEFVVTNPDGKEFGEGKGTATVKLDKDESNIIVKTKKIHNGNTEKCNCIKCKNRKQACYIQ